MGIIYSVYWHERYKSLITYLQYVQDKLLQSCLTLCDPMDCSPLGSSVHGILQARIMEWAAMPSSRGSSWLRDQTCVSCFAGRLFTTEPPGKPSAMLKTKIFIKQNIFISLVPKYELSMFFVWCIFLRKYWCAWLESEPPNSIGTVNLYMHMYVLYFKVQNCES